MNVSKDIIKPIAVLVIITLVVSAAVAVTYRFTKVEDTGPDLNEINTLGKELMSEADEFEQLETEAEGAKYLFKAKNNAGILVIAEAKGYNGSVPIVFIVGFDKNGTITGFHVLSQQETPPLGDRVTKEEFSAQLIGKTGNLELKTGSENSIDGISGATVTTKGVVAGINKARQVFDTVKGALVS